MTMIPAQPSWYVGYHPDEYVESGEPVEQNRLPVIAWGIDENGDGGIVYVLSHDDTGEPTIGPLTAEKAPMYYGVFHADYRPQS